MYVIEDNRLITLLVIAGIIYVIFIIIRNIFRFIKWFLSSIWCLLTGKQRKRKDPLQSDDWLVRAQARQEVRFQNSMPPSAFKQKKWSPTGWYYDEEKGEWVAPDYIVEEANTRWEWNDEKRIWIDNSQKKRKKRR